VGGVVSGVTVTVACEVTVPLLFVAVSVYVVVVEGDTAFDVVPVTVPTPLLIESVGAGVPDTVHDNVDELPLTIDAGVAMNDEITGAVFATVTAMPADVAEFPDVSVAKAVSVCAAFEAVVEFQEIEYGAVVMAAPMFAPSNLNCTLATATLSAALAVNETVPVRVAPAEGAVTETVGGVVSAAGVEPVRPTWCGLPAALSEIVMEPFCVPATVGENLTLMVQLLLAARVEGLIGQVFV